jgi:hypothetical protein
MIQDLRKLQIAVQGLILFFVPLPWVFLRQAGTVTNHAFYQVVGHLAIGHRPILADLVITPEQEQGQQHPQDQQPGIQPAPRTARQDQNRHEQFDEGEQGQQSAAQAEHLDGFGFHDAPRNCPMP